MFDVHRVCFERLLTSFSLTNALLLVSYESYELYGRSAVVYIGRCSFSSSKMIRFEKYGREVFWLMHARSINSAVLVLM